MIDTFYSSGKLGTPGAFLAALLIGLAFGFALERAGFGSSRKLAGIFYFKDMTVLKVMFSGLITAMLGLVAFVAVGAIRLDQIFLMPTFYGGQIVAGLIFGVGFVMGGWCPGTAVVGMASGKVDALIFLGAATVGSILYNELYRVVAPLASWGAQGVQFAWANLGMSHGAFALFFTLVGVGCFWGAEWLEKRFGGEGTYFKSPFLRTFSVVLVMVAVSLAILPSAMPAGAPSSGTQDFLTAIESAEDHIEPEELADRLLAGDAGLLVVDTRTPQEFATFHIRTAVNIGLSDLPAQLNGSAGTIVVLYSNGMTHPAQARDELARAGHRNIYILTDGLKGFIERCLKPVSLRSDPLPRAEAARVNAWRRFFLKPTTAQTRAPAKTPGMLPRLVETAYLAENLENPRVRIIDVRGQKPFTTGHIPGSTFLHPETFRGVGGVTSMLLPPTLLAQHLSLLGIRPETQVIVNTERMQDATLIALGLERLGHKEYAVLNGGFEKWAAENRPLTTELPSITPSVYPADRKADAFMIDYTRVLEYANNRRALIIDARPAAYFVGEKSNEARPGHIHGAINRPYTEDVTTAENGVTKFKPLEELAAAYAALIPSKDTTVVAHCRTGHQISQTYFVLTKLLGYRNVLFYDGGWSEWAARPGLPAQRGS